jgi:predicted HicB family RNase H-like nuclease
MPREKSSIKKPVMIRMDDREKAAAEEKAADMGLSLSAYIRHLLYRDNPDLGRKKERGKR